VGELPSIEMEVGHPILAAGEDYLHTETVRQARLVVDAASRVRLKAIVRRCPAAGEIGDEEPRALDLRHNLIVDLAIVMKAINAEWLVASIANSWSEAGSPSLLHLVRKPHCYEGLQTISASVKRFDGLKSLCS